MGDIHDISYHLMQLQREIWAKGLKLEHIKLNYPLYDGKTQVKIINGVEIKDTIYEHDATHWLSAGEAGVQPPRPKQPLPKTEVEPK